MTKVNVSKEWCERMADLEDGCAVGAGLLARDPELPNWARCPSTHCERRRECASPNDCAVKSEGGFLRAAFDSDDVPTKNIALRHAHDKIADLLAALKAVVAVADRDTKEFAQARAAIAKAEA